MVLQSFPFVDRTIYQVFSRPVQKLQKIFMDITKARAVILLLHQKFFLFTIVRAYPGRVKSRVKTAEGLNLGASLVKALTEVIC